MGVPCCMPHPCSTYRNYTSLSVDYILWCREHFSIRTKIKFLHLNVYNLTTTKTFINNSFMNKLIRPVKRISLKFVYTHKIQTKYYWWSALIIPPLGFVDSKLRLRLYNGMVVSTDSPDVLWNTATNLTLCAGLN